MTKLQKYAFSRISEVQGRGEGPAPPPPSIPHFFLVHFLVVFLFSTFSSTALDIVVIGIFWRFLQFVIRDSYENSEFDYMDMDIKGFINVPEKNKCDENLQNKKMMQLLQS